MDIIILASFYIINSDFYSWIFRVYYINSTISNSCSQYSRYLHLRILRIVATFRRPHFVLLDFFWRWVLLVYFWIIHIHIPDKLYLFLNKLHTWFISSYTTNYKLLLEARTVLNSICWNWSVDNRKTWLFIVFSQARTLNFEFHRLCYKLLCYVVSPNSSSHISLLENLLDYHLLYLCYYQMYSVLSDNILDTLT